MFPIYCNNCAEKHSIQAVPFQLTRCQHIICGSCMSETTDSGTKCPVCEHTLHAVAITHDMPANVAHYFQDASRYLKLYKTISQFQTEQRAIHYRQYYSLECLADEKRKELEGYLKLEKQLRQQIDAEKKRIAELRNYVEYNERDGSFSSSDINSSSRRMCRPCTPSFRSTDTVTTDNDNDAALSVKLLRNEFNQMN